MEMERLLILVEILNIKRGRNVSKDAIIGAQKVFEGCDKQDRYSNALVLRVNELIELIDNYSNDLFGNYLLFSEISGIDGTKPAHRAVLNSIKNGTTVSKECELLGCFSFTAYSLKSRIEKLHKLRKKLESFQ